MIGFILGMVGLVVGVVEAAVGLLCSLAGSVITMVLLALIIVGSILFSPAFLLAGLVLAAFAIIRKLGRELDSY